MESPTPGLLTVTRSLRHAGRFDWDGLQTLILTSLLLTASSGLLLVPTLSQVFRTARTAPDKAHGGGPCLIFGKYCRDGRVDREFRKRLQKAAELFRDQPRTLILLGGHTTPGGSSEAAIGLHELKRSGLPENAPIHLEEKSTHTLENLRNARELCESTPILISNRYHLARCSLIASSLGIKHTLCAAESSLDKDPITYFNLLKESFFVLWFQVGRGWAQLTRNRRMLDRIS